MRHFEFYQLVYNNIILYIVSLVICSSFFYYIGKNYTRTWFDPLRIFLVTYTFSLTVLVFLYLTSTINLDIFIYFLLAELTFWFAFMLAAKGEVHFSGKVLVNEGKVAFILFLIFLFLYIIFTVTTYFLLGIPILLKTRLDTYAGSGFGFLGRMIPFFKIYCMIYSFYLWEKWEKLSLKKIIIVLVFFIFIVTGILSGSRSVFFVFLFTYWGYCYFYKKDISNIFKYYKIFIFGIFIILISFILTTNSTSVLAGAGQFLLRLISSGDHYYMALPNNIWEHIEIKSWFNHLFYGLLGPLRIIGEDSVSPPIGYQLTWLVNPSLKGLHVGPLSSPALLGFIYFRWGGLVFSFFIGFLVSFIIFKLPPLLPKGIISSVLSTYIYVQVLAFIGDPCMGMGCLFDTIFNIIFLVFLILFISNFCKSLK